MNVRAHRIFGAWLLLLSIKTEAYPDFEPAANYTSRSYSISKPATTPTEQLSVAIQGGFGQFPDLQVPQIPSSESRSADSSNTESAMHLGPAVAGDIGWQYGSKKLRWLSNARLTRVSSIAGDTDRRPASYLLRLDLQQSAWLALSEQWSLGADAAVTRLAFRGIDQGHYLDSVPLGLSLRWQKNGAACLIGARWSPLTQFGYGGQRLLSRDGNLDATAEQVEVWSAARFDIGDSAAITLNVAQQMNTVTINDTRQYEQFGLVVDRTQNQSPTYDLSVFTALFGIARSF